jgi:hypothetical protein
MGRSDSVAYWVGSALIGVAVLVILVGPWRRLTVPRVALWIEERVPRLQYALVTAVDPATASAATGPLLDRQIASVSWSAETRRAIVRALAWPVLRQSRQSSFVVGAAWRFRWSGSNAHRSSVGHVHRVAERRVAVCSSVRNGACAGIRRWARAAGGVASVDRCAGRQ